MFRVPFMLLVLALLCARAAEAALPVGTRYVMSHFRNDGGGGDERLYISVSPDGLAWTALNGGNSVYQPVGWARFTNVVRDPAIIYANGFYWVAHTSGNYGHRDSSAAVTGSFALLKSADLLAWTHVGEISTVTPGATDPLTWSPTFFRDGDGTVRVYVAIRPHGGSSLVPVPGMRVHELHPLNPEWTLWSEPVLVALPSTNTNEFSVWKEGAVYHGIYVDFTRGGSPYVHVTSADPVTGWSNPLELGFYGQEGGFVLKRPGGGYRVYTEQGNSAGATYLYTDFGPNFTAGTQQRAVQSTVPMRNGKVIAAPEGTTYADWSSARLATVPVDARAAAGDPDRDGLPNVLEFATGGHPLQSEAEPLLMPLGNGGVRYRRAAGAEARLTLEVSTDLRTWSSGLGNTSELSATLRTDGTEEIVASTAQGLAVGGWVFFRLRGEVETAAPAPVVTTISSRTVPPQLRAARRLAPPHAPGGTPAVARLPKWRLSSPGEPPCLLRIW